ncbi:16308_t:CDS:1, partial [Dentiscutata heterogama]
AKSLLNKALSFLDKKVCGSLNITENFKSEDLAQYLDMVDKINNTNIINYWNEKIFWRDDWCD